MPAHNTGICVKGKEEISSAVFRISGHTEEGNRMGHIRRKMILGFPAQECFGDLVPCVGEALLG